MYSPEDYDVEIVYQWDAFEPDWDFDIVLIVRDKLSRKLYAAADSGCSCPTPFEDHKYPADFVEVRSWEDVKSFINAQFPRGGYRARKPLDNIRTAVRKALA